MNVKKFKEYMDMYYEQNRKMAYWLAKAEAFEEVGEKEKKKEALVKAKECFDKLEDSLKKAADLREML